MRKNSIIRNMSIVLCCFISIGLLAQSNKTVTLVVSGEAKTKDEATKQALRSAIEQAFGTFVSAHTEVLNDELIQDEIVSISTGNIAGYKEVNYTESPDGSKSITLEATVSIGELTNFAKSKGMSAELAGETFVMNMKIRELNKRNELQAILDLQKKIQKIHESCNLFDYELELSEPYVKDDKFAINAFISIVPNENLFKFQNIINSTFMALSLSDTEVDEYDRANIRTYGILIKDMNKFKMTVENRKDNTKGEWGNDMSFLYSLWLFESAHPNNDFPNYVNPDIHFEFGDERINISAENKWIYLRNDISKLLPNALFSTILLQNELQFALKDNLGNLYRTFYCQVPDGLWSYDDDGSIIDRWIIASSTNALWVADESNEQYPKDRITYDFGIMGPKGICVPLKKKIYSYMNGSLRAKHNEKYLSRFDYEDKLQKPFDYRLPGYSYSHYDGDSNTHVEGFPDEWLFQNAQVVIQLEYPMDELEQLNNIELCYMKPYYLEQPSNKMYRGLSRK